MSDLQNDLKKLTDKINDINSMQKFPIYLCSLLFACALNITWLIITFSVLLFITVFISMNKHFHFITLKPVHEKTNEIKVVNKR